MTLPSAHAERKSLALGSKLAGWTRTLNPPGEKDAVTGDHLAATVAPFVLDRFKETAAKVGPPSCGEGGCRAELA